MIDIEKVKSNVKSLGGFSTETIDEYNFIIENAINSIELSLIYDEYSLDSRVVFLASAKAYYQIALAMNNTDGITSFSAGDLKIQKDSDFILNVGAIYDSAKEDCKGLIADDNFAFLGV